MKIKNHVLPIFSLLLISCTNRSKEKIIKDKNIEVSWYQVSEITTIHDFVEVTKEGVTKELLEANNMGIVGIYIRNDSIFIKIYPPLLFYSLKDKIFNYHAIIDSTATHNEWSKIYQPEFAK